MIRLTRTTPEPAALKETRDIELPKARAAAAAGGKGADGKAFKFTGYDAGKQALFADQYQKCAYCEKREEQAKYRDVEHYRPKSSYWWLAWTWENLLFACFECNREHKKQQFPLADESHRLVAEAVPPGQEQPLLLDPFDPSFDPRHHIQFRRERVPGKERWIPYGRSPAGTATIQVCGLARASLIDRYSEHVNTVVRPRLQVFHVAVAAGDVRAIADAWSTTWRALLAPRQEFCALSLDALAVLVPSATRERYRLEQ